MPRSIRVACLSLTSVATLAAFAGPAFAQELDGAPVPAPSPLVFPTMAADGIASELDVQLGYQNLEDTDTSIKRIDLGAQFVGEGGLGGYGRVNMAFAEDTQAIGNIELGGLFRVRRPSIDTALRVGVILPTASDDFDNTLVSLASTSLARPSDLVTGIPTMTTLRVAVAPTYRTGVVVLRADVGLDIPVDADGDTPDPIYHLDVGAGYDGGDVGVIGELQTVGSTDSDADGTLHVLAVTAQGRTGKLSPYATLSLPFSTEDDDDIAGSFNLFAGLRYGL